jgi:hypothetical protein
MSCCGAHKEALSIQQTVSQGLLTQLGEHPETLTAIHNVALTLKSLARFDEVCFLYSQLISLSIGLNGEWHPDTIRYVREYSEVLLEADRPKEARQQRKELRRLEKLSRRSQKPRAAAKLGVTIRCAMCQSAGKELKCCSLCKSTWYCSEGATEWVSVCVFDLCVYHFRVPYQAQTGSQAVMQEATGVCSVRCTKAPRASRCVHRVSRDVLLR